MREILKNLALLFPPVREHYKNVQAVRAELAAFKSRFNTSRLGPFFPQGTAASLKDEEREIVDRFHDLYYRLGQRGENTNHVSWLGYSSLKCPLDLWIYHELICRIQPEFIVETGTASGGSALFLASMCDLIDHGQVLTIDVDARVGQRRPVHPRISYIVGSSTDLAVIGRVRTALNGKSCGLVILDSDHHRDHVLDEMRAFADLVAVGGYLIVEDTNINGHPTHPDFGPGPMEAVKQFLAETDTFQVDRGCERFLLTMNPNGFLRRIK
jgi:cephalosporin hydroxylase